MEFDMFEISRIILPQKNFEQYQELFFRNESNDDNISVLKFNTWMNLFASKKYHKYCNLGDLYLDAKIDGKYTIRIVGSNFSSASKRLDSIILEKDCENDEIFNIANAHKFDGIYFELINKTTEPITIKQISWKTNKKPMRDNKLAIVSCTFKREEYIGNNVKNFEKFISDNPELDGKIKFFISDNGKTLPDSLNSNNVTVYPNMNAGGAGGFTRGLIEVMNLDEKFDRVLFMDDDVEIFQECLRRTLYLINYLKDEYNEAFINGAMMNLDKKNIFHENLAFQHKLFVDADNRCKDVCDYNKILELNCFSDEMFSNPQKRISSAWWYHCLNVETVKKMGLPCPLFIRGDDVEWSWRNYGKHHISLNGICIWHAPFEHRVSKVVDAYYATRNFFFMNTIYNPDFKYNFKKWYRNVYKRVLQCYDYISCDLYLKAFRDILSGAQAFKMNPQEQFAQLNAIAKKTEIFECDDENNLEILKTRKPHIEKWRTNLHRLTSWGILCPDIFFKKEGISFDFWPPKTDFMLVKEVKTYNMLSGKYEIRKFDRKKIIYYRNEFKKTMDELSVNFDRLKNEFEQAHKEFTTEEFWRNYLEIDNKSKIKEMALVN